MVKKVKFIEDNIVLIRRLVRNGDLSTKILTDYQMYKAYKANKHPSKMQRYSDTATEFRVCSRTIVKAVKNMERVLK